MSKLNAAYLAGIIDGEGYVSIMKSMRGNKKDFHSPRGYTYVPVIKVAMIDRPLIEFLYHSYGGSFEIRKARHHQNARESYCWTLRGGKLVWNMLQTIYPYMRVKRKHAEIMFRFRNLNDGAGHQINDDNWTKRDKLYEDIRNITKKGTVRD